MRRQWRGDWAERSEQRTSPSSPASFQTTHIPVFPSLPYHIHLLRLYVIPHIRFIIIRVNRNIPLVSIKLLLTLLWMLLTAKRLLRNNRFEEQFDLLTLFVRLSLYLLNCLTMT